MTHGQDFRLFKDMMSEGSVPTIITWRVNYLGTGEIPIEFLCLELLFPLGCDL